MFPKPNDRTVILGRTGSGKTVAAVWHLSNADFFRKPWIVFDYKGDGLIAKIPTTPLDVNNLRVPSEPGIYRIQPLAVVDDDKIESFLWEVLRRGNVGLYVDEGYMLPNNGRSMAYRAIQTQGRSKNIGTITLSQRPVWVDRFILSEADFYQVFHLNDKRDRQTIGSFLPENYGDLLAPFHSAYYDVKKNDFVTMLPVDLDGIVSRFSPVQLAEADEIIISTPRLIIT